MSKSLSSKLETTPLLPQYCIQRQCAVYSTEAGAFTFADPWLEVTPAEGAYGEGEHYQRVGCGIGDHHAARHGSRTEHEAKSLIGGEQGRRHQVGRQPPERLYRHEEAGY